MLKVSELLQYVKKLFAADVVLQNVIVTGEISSYRPHSSGHMYFVLKDEQAQVKCVMFRSRNANLKFHAENGVHVVAKGYFSLYERDGQVQLYVEEMFQAGIGKLYQAYEKLKAELNAQGLFNPKFKKQLPFLPKKIGVVSSSSGAVINDIRIVLARRFPCEIVLAPAQVQGEGAVFSIVTALATLEQLPDIDVIIIARGGGSLEDLWPFNTEEVARAVFACSLPVISAVGHETDFTICDFVADVRAATPSQAAEIVVPVKEELIQQLTQVKIRLVNAFKKTLQLKRQHLNAVAKNTIFKQPWRLLTDPRQELDNMQHKIQGAMQLLYTQKQAILADKAARLNSLSPLNVLGRGYVIAYDSRGRLLKSVKQVQPKDNLLLKTRDGEIFCSVGQVGGNRDEKN